MTRQPCADNVRTRVRVLAILCGALGTLPAAAIADPVLQSFPAPIGFTSGVQVSGMSGDGTTLVGTLFRPGLFTAFRWTSAGGVEDLGPLPGGAPPNYSEAYGASFDGSGVVGWGYDANSNGAAARWSGGTVQQVGAAISYARAISADGQVAVGGFGNYLGSGEAHACRFQTGAPLIPLAELTGALTSQANSVSHDGAVIVGSSDSSDGSRAVRWTASGVQSLGVLTGGSSSVAYVVSGDGSTVFGASNIGDGFAAPAFRWTEAGGMEDIGVIAGMDSAQPTSASADGSSLVGYGYHSVTGEEAPMLWTSTLGMMNLRVYLAAIAVDLAGWQNLYVTGISADGTVLGGGGVFNGESRGWIVSGVPAPASISVLLLGAAFAPRRRRGA